MLKEKIINETVETIIDSIYEVTQEYMYESNQYDESNDKFVEEQEKYVIEVIKELNNRINK
tara:strand:+ start:37 stop:219 length:183 start_codon:yes stop_codon:yes gene_type:complete